MSYDTKNYKSSIQNLKYAIENENKNILLYIKELLFLQKMIRDFISREIVNIAEEMNSIYQEVFNTAKADGFHLDINETIQSFKYQDVFIVQESYGTALDMVEIPYCYLTDPNWKEKYRNECEILKQKIELENVKSINENKEYQEYQEYLRLKDKFENQSSS